MAGRLWDVQTALWAPVEAAFQAQASPPERLYISEGTPAWDCSSLVLTLERLRPGQPGGAQGQGPIGESISAATGLIHNAMSWTVEVAFTVLRCAAAIPEGAAAPSAAAIEAVAQQVADDAWLLWSTVTGSELSGAYGSCSPMAIPEVTPVGPEGGLVGSRMVVHVGL